MAFFRNVPALVGLALIIAVGLMETGHWPDAWWRPFIVREVTRVEYTPVEGESYEVIDKLCADPGAGWSPRTRHEIIRDMDEDDIRYAVRCEKDGVVSEARVEKFVLKGELWVKTERTITTCDNLEQLKRGCGTIPEPNDEE